MDCRDSCLHALPLLMRHEQSGVRLVWVDCLISQCASLWYTYHMLLMDNVQSGDNRETGDAPMLRVAELWSIR